MNHLNLMIRANARDQFRWARRHLYSLLILSPLVLGMTYWAAARAASEAPELWQVSPFVGGVLGAFVVISLIGLNLSRASVEIYHLRRPESVLDVLPVTLATQFHVALINRLSRTALAVMVALVVRSFFVERAMVNAPLLVSLVVLMALVALGEAVAALNWIHWGHTGDVRAACAALAILVPAITLAGLLLAGIVKPDARFARYHSWLILISALWTALVYFYAQRVHRHWRASDIEYAKRLQASDRHGLFSIERVCQRWFEPVVSAQLARDLQLTLRAFSSAVYVACGIAALVVALMITLLLTGSLPTAETPSGWFEMTWLPSVMAIKLAAVFASTSLAALMPVLVAHQIPHRWLERAAGTTGEEMWEAKLWYVRLVSLPAPLAAWAAGVATGGVPLFYVIPLLGECLWIWWMVTTLFGMLSFEMPDQPGLALVLMVTVAAGIGFFVALLWPIGLALYAFGIAQKTERGHARAGYHLIGEEE